MSDESARSSAQSFQEQPLSTLVSRLPLLFAIMIFFFSLIAARSPLPLYLFTSQVESDYYDIQIPSFLPSKQNNIITQGTEKDIITFFRTSPVETSPEETEKDE